MKLNYIKHKITNIIKIWSNKPTAAKNILLNKNLIIFLSVFLPTTTPPQIFNHAYYTTKQHLLKYIYVNFLYNFYISLI